MGHAAEAKQVNRMALQAIDDLPAERKSAQAYATLLSEIENSYAAMSPRPEMEIAVDTSF